MKLKNTFFGIVFAVSATACYADGGNNMVYDYIGTPLVSIDAGSKEVNHTFGFVRLDLSEKTITSQDAVLPLDVCAAKDKMNCAFGGGLSFAVPNDGLIVGTWIYKGFAFHELGKRDISVFGVKHTVHVIEARRSGESSPKTVSISYYSEKDGLLGFSLFYPDQNMTETYFLKGIKGYAPISN